METRPVQLYVCFRINLYVGDYGNIFVKTGQQVALSNQCATPRPNVCLASEFGRELVYVMEQNCAQRNLVLESSHVQQGLCTEKPRHGQYPCAAGTLHRETEAWTVPMCSRNFAKRNRGMDSTHVQQEL